MSLPVRRSILVAIAVATALSVSACGRRGALEPPPAATTTSQPAPAQSNAILLDKPAF